MSAAVSDLVTATVLLVEDNHDNIEIYTAIMEHAGLRVLVAMDGPSGLACAREARPDLILMDAGLPIMNGWDVTRALKGDPATAGARILMLTAHALYEDVQRSRDAGADGHLSKPIEPRAVLDAVLATLRGGAEAGGPWPTID